MFRSLPYAQVLNNLLQVEKNRYYTIKPSAATTWFFFCTYFINILFNIIF